MKLILVGTLIGTLAMAPALADSPRQVGQDVFDLQGARVGKVVKYLDVHGTPGVVITGKNGHTFITQAENLGPRADGGLLLALSGSDLAQQRPYDPAHLPLW